MKESREGERGGKAGSQEGMDETRRELPPSGQEPLLRPEAPWLPLNSPTQEARSGQDGRNQQRAN